MRQLIRLAALVALTVVAGPARARSFEVPGRGHVELAVPPGWVVETLTDPATQYPTLTLRPQAGKAFSVQITVTFDTRDPMAVPVPPAMARRFAREALERAAPAALERTLVLSELGGAHPGWVFDATEPAPGPGEWSHATHGTVAMGPVTLFFTILTFERDTPERTAALEMLRTARHVPPPALPVDPLVLRLPGRSWSLQLDLRGFQVGPLQPTSAGGVSAYGADAATGLVASVFLERAEGPDSGQVACERYQARRGKVSLAPGSLKVGKRAGLDAVEYLVPEVGGLPLHQKNVYGCLARDGVWMEIHLSKLDYAPGDEALFDRVLQSARIAEDR